MLAPSESNSTRRASAASPDPSSRSTFSRRARSAAALYAAPVLRFTTPRRPATARATELFPLPAGPSMATRIPPIDPGSIADSPRASPQGFQPPEVVGEGLGHAPRVPNANAWHDEPRHRERHRHPVVAISLHNRRPYCLGYYADR